MTPPPAGGGVTSQPGARDAEVARLTAAGATILEQYIRQYPTQWYLFRDFDQPAPAAIS